MTEQNNDSYFLSPYIIRRAIRKYFAEAKLSEVGYHLGILKIFWHYLRVHGNSIQLAILKNDSALLTLCDL